MLDTSKMRGRSGFFILRNSQEVNYNWNLFFLLRCHFVLFPIPFCLFQCRFVLFSYAILPFPIPFCHFSNTVHSFPIRCVLFPIPFITFPIAFIFFSLPFILVRFYVQTLYFSINPLHSLFMSILPLGFCLDPPFPWLYAAPTALRFH